MNEVDKSFYGDGLGIGNLEILQFQHVEEVISLQQFFNENTKPGSKDVQHDDWVLTIQSLIPTHAMVRCTNGNEFPQLDNTLEFQAFHDFFYSPEGIIISLRSFFNHLEKPKDRKSYEDDTNSKNEIKFSFYEQLLKAFFLRVDAFVQRGGASGNSTFELDVRLLTGSIGQIRKDQNKFSEFEDILEFILKNPPSRVLTDPERDSFWELFISLRDSILTNLPTDPKSFLIDLEKDNTFNKLFQNYIEFLKNIDSSKQNQVSFISFNWHEMSSGEKAFLGLFSKLFKAKEQADQKREIRKLFLVIDEGEIGFHPQWQREFINRLTSFLELVFSPYQVQIFLTSHSPILIS